MAMRPLERSRRDREPGSDVFGEVRGHLREQRGGNRSRLPRLGENHGSACGKSNPAISSTALSRIAP